ncbi:Undecaprenyl pyrophosphate synthase UppS [Methanonatronarchaeum thermophilum]|uniref:Undecaprenyl pyrophosphate synthase UppS n=1 Tax=Methanonatronarchaeum thermophilum TaxID=1927129 RepID=A0A1Y3GAU9_9EURY|nr:undecaprenyl diphosphate synthase family protein [Methanonatronarchaeum thermophilum]OUJ18572.1 Undecaprenyl pyrophosphate synthase UppS [Methanonatronarchaeum thermophilum]
MGDLWNIDRIGIVVPDWGSLRIGRLFSVVNEFWERGVSKVVLGFPGASEDLKERVLDVFDSSGGEVVVVCKTGREEVLSSLRRVCRLVCGGEVVVEDVDEEFLGRFFDSGSDLDILIKVGGERLPNSLLWSLSYSEFFFVESFDGLDDGFVEYVFDEFRARERRFGR